jgi:hypothetical protein
LVYIINFTLKIIKFIKMNEFDYKL